MNKLTGGERIILAAAALLVVDLFLLPWHLVESITPQGRAIDEDITAVQSPLGVLGIVAALVAVVMIVQIALARFTSVRVPEPPVPWPQVHLAAAIAVLAVLLLKVVLEAHDLGLGCYVGILAAVVLVYGGWFFSGETAANGQRRAPRGRTSDAPSG